MDAGRITDIGAATAAVWLRQRGTSSLAPSAMQMGLSCVKLGEPRCVIATPIVGSAPPYSALERRSLKKA